MLEGKVALVTGGGRGIGRAIALKLAAYGAAVAVNYCGSKEKAEEVADLILKNGGKAKVYACNVADFQAGKEMTEQVIKDFGGLDILVNNAGITRDNLLMKMSEEEFDMVLNTNLKGTFHTMRHVSRYMLKQRKGKIINISSVSGFGNAGQANCSQQSRSSGSYKDSGKGAGLPGYYSKCHCAGICGNRHDKGAEKGSSGGSLQPDSPGTFWKSRGRGGNGCISGFG